MTAKVLEQRINFNGNSHIVQAFHPTQGYKKKGFLSCISLDSLFVPSPA